MITLLPIALISGFLTVFSPCVLPILPVILASGTDGNKARVNGTIIGLIVSFSIAALFFASLVSALGISADDVRTLAAALLFLIGLSILFPIWEKIQPYFESFFSKPVDTRYTGFVGGLITGASLGFVWTPCVGPIVATISTLAATQGVGLNSILLVLSYALGIGIPLLLIAQKGSNFSSRLGLLKTNPLIVRQLFGAILLLTSVFIYSGAEKKLQIWFLDNLPENWTQLASSVEGRFNVSTELKSLNTKKKAPNGVSFSNFGRDIKYYRVEGKRKPVKEGLDPDNIVTGCFGGFDCIPSIDDPVFDTAEVADSWLNGADVIFGVNRNGIRKAYPQRIMNWHEIVNDYFGEEPVVVTFCPLCGTAISFERVVNGEVTEFGVSGKLYNSDLIMYDRESKNLWQQLTGEAIVGESALENQVLQKIPTTTTSWEKWKNKYPDTLVLSTSTGFSRDYGEYPYDSYETDQRLLFNVENENSLYHRKKVKLGIVVNNIPKAYFIEDLKIVLDAGDTITDTIGDSVVEITRTSADEFIFVEQTTKQEVVSIRGFWFAWFAFYPDTKVFEP